MQSDVGPFSIIPEWLIGRVSANALALFALLGRYANTEGQAWPSQTTLATRLGVTRQSIINWLNELEGAKAIQRIQRKTESGDPDTCLYFLHYANPEVSTTVDRVVNVGLPGVVNVGLPGVVNDGLHKREPIERKPIERKYVHAENSVDVIFSASDAAAKFLEICDWGSPNRVSVKNLLNRLHLDGVDMRVIFDGASRWRRWYEAQGTLPKFREKPIRFLEQRGWEEKWDAPKAVPSSDPNSPNYSPAEQVKRLAAKLQMEASNAK